jgi:hypothetical protein
MGIRRRNRLVSVNADRRQFPPRRGFPGTRSGKPHARDPPLARPRNLTAPPGEEPPHRQRRNRKEAMREHRLLPMPDSQS